MNTVVVPTLSNEESLLLWTLAGQGDLEAFGRLCEGHYKSLFNYATNFSDDIELIKDVIQDLYLNLWENRQNMQITSMSPYLLRAVRNNLFHLQRSQKRVLTSLKDYFLDETDPYHDEADFIRKEAESALSQLLTEAIDRLPVRQREIVFMKFYQGLNNEQIAEILNINRQSVANLVSRALMRLRVYLPKEYWLILLVKVLSTDFSLL